MRSQNKDLECLEDLLSEMNWRSEQRRYRICRYYAESSAKPAVFAYVLPEPTETRLDDAFGILRGCASRRFESGWSQSTSMVVFCAGTFDDQKSFVAG